ncbi:MAG: NAD-dependent epimerase/dehydratase family protein [Bryobacteraceae bacterium]
MKCLITGGAGFIGSHLVKRLLFEAQVTVNILDNFSRVKGPTQVTDGSELFLGDIRNRNDLRNAMADCEVVFHLAAESTVMGCEQRPADAHSVNVTGTYNVLSLASELGVRRLVFTSSREVYGEVQQLPVREDHRLQPKNAYGASKAASEMYCSSFRAQGLEVTSLRLSNIFGPGDFGRAIPNFINEAAAGRPITVYGGSQLVDFLWIEPAVTSIMRAGLGPYIPGSVNIGSGVGNTILDTANRVISALGSPSTIMSFAAREVEVSRFVSDVGRARAELGLAAITDPLLPLNTLLSCEAADGFAVSPHSKWPKLAGTDSLWR